MGVVRDLFENTNIVTDKVSVSRQLFELSSFSDGWFISFDI